MQRTKKAPLLLTEKNTSDIFFFSLHLEVVVTLESSLLSNDVIFAKAIHEFSGSIHYLLLLLPFVVQFYRDFIATQGQFFHRTKGGTWWFQLWKQREKEKKRERESKTFFFL